LPSWSWVARTRTPVQVEQGVDDAPGDHPGPDVVAVDRLPGIGDAIGDFFNTISNHADDADTFFNDLLHAVEYLIRAITVLVAMAGLAFDVGQTMVDRRRQQDTSDAAALARSVRTGTVLCRRSGGEPVRRC